MEYCELIVRKTEEMICAVRKALPELAMGFWRGEESGRGGCKGRA